jgi:hypothetical protein
MRIQSFVPSSNPPRIQFTRCYGPVVCPGRTVRPRRNYRRNASIRFDD